MPKKDFFISIYLLDIKTIVNTLTIVGLPITPDDHIEATLDGLSKDYDNFITYVFLRLYPYVVQQIEALLFAQEESFKKNFFEQNLL